MEYEDRLLTVREMSVNYLLRFACLFRTTYIYGSRSMLCIYTDCLHENDLIPDYMYVTGNLLAFTA